MEVAARRDEPTPNAEVRTGDASAEPSFVDSAADASQRLRSPLRASARRERAISIVGSVASGLVVAFAIPPCPTPWIALVAYAPLVFLAITAPTVRSAARRGLLAGAVATGLAFRFLLPPMQSAGGLGLASALAAYGALTLWHALPFAVGAATGAFVERRRGSGALCAAVVWTALERVWPVPIPWCFGASLEGMRPLLMSASIAGPLGPTALALIAAAGVVDAARWAYAWRRGRGLGNAALGRAAIVASLLLLAAWIVGTQRIVDVARAADAAPRLDIGVVQPGASPSEASLSEMLDAADELAARGAALVVFSEGAFPGVLPDADALPLVDAAFADTAGQTSLWVGAITRDRQGRLRNAAFLIGRGGDASGRYDKRALLPFAERLPLEAELPWLRDLSPRSGRFIEGAPRAQLSARGARLVPTICYEDLSPSRAGGLDGSTPGVLVNATNDSWFDGSEAPRTHAAMARLRAIEAGRALVRATNDGATVVFGPDGTTLAAIPIGTRGAIVVATPILSAPTPFSRWGATPAWCALVALGSFAWARSRGPRGTRPPRRANPDRRRAPDGRRAKTAVSAPRSSGLS